MYAPERWYEQDEELGYYECGACNKVKENLEYAKDFFDGVVQELYSDKEIDIVKLEFWLDELASYLDTKLPKGELKIRR